MQVIKSSDRQKKKVFENLSKHLVGLIVQLQFNEIGKETGEEEFLLSASKYYLKSSVKTFKKKTHYADDQNAKRR